MTWLGNLRSRASRNRARLRGEKRARVSLRTRVLRVDPRALRWEFRALSASGARSFEQRSGQIRLAQHQPFDLTTDTSDGDARPER
jgi:hypothetical protein